MMEQKSSVAEPTSDVDQIISSLKQILVHDLNVALEIEDIEPGRLRLEQDLKIDSVAMVELIGAIESRFEFSFQDVDLVTASFANLRVLAGVIARRVAACGAGAA
jgi:acyl carrier protein